MVAAGQGVRRVPSALVDRARLAPPAAEEPADEGIAVHRPLSEVPGPELEYLGGLASEFRSADPAIAALGRRMRETREH